MGHAANKTFEQSQLQAIADALGHTDDGLTGREIGYLLNVARIADVDPTNNKRTRILNAFVLSQNSKQHRRHILEFVRQAAKPAFYTQQPERYEPMRARLNTALAFCGLAVDAGGALSSVDAASTLTEAQRRARELREDLAARDVHPDVVACCREEWMADDYFHVLLEATKSINLKLQNRTGLVVDGGELVDRVFGGDEPMLAINRWITVAEKAEQKGLVNILKGLFGLFRHPTAHEARLRWTVEKRDAEEALALLSFAHRRIDEAVVRTRA